MPIVEIKSESDVVSALANKTEFERSVLVATYKIPFGKVSTYKRIAEKINKPRAYRAVANALHKNPLYPIVPCHRVVCSNGKFGGDARHAQDRRQIVKSEGVPIRNGKVMLSDEILF